MLATAADDLMSRLQWGHRLSAMERWIIPTFPSIDPTLQWGHRLSAMEIQYATIAAQRIPALQWGHRLSAMERLMQQRRYLDVKHASMGPPPFGDGKRSVAPPVSGCCPCFNGATAFRRWKTVISWYCWSHLKCFNGATAFRRWKVGGGYPRWPYRGALQWGHRLSAMERVMKYGIVGDVTIRFNGATAFRRWKGPSGCCGRPSASLLQWGHRLSAMESPH